MGQPSPVSDEILADRTTEAIRESALAAVRQGRYQPLLLNGQPTEFILTVTVMFNIRPSTP